MASNPVDYSILVKELYSIFSKIFSAHLLASVTSLTMDLNERVNV
jgi:hypothetical protein